MIFKLYLQDKAKSMIGYEWLEVLAIVPFRFTMHGVCKECGEAHDDEGAFWLAQSWFYCRTEKGLTQLSEDDVMEEVHQGIYCEAGGEEQAKLMRERMAESRALREAEWEAHREEIDEDDTDLC